MSDTAKSIRFGSIIAASGGEAALHIAKMADMGFESFEPFFWQTTNSQNIAELGKACLDAIGDRDITNSTLGVFGNPLETREMDLASLQAWKDCIDNAHHFGATCVAASPAVFGAVPCPKACRATSRSGPNWPNARRTRA